MIALVGLGISSGGLIVLLANGQWIDAGQVANTALRLLRTAPGGGIAANALMALQGEVYLRSAAREKGRAAFDEAAKRLRAAPGPDAWARPRKVWSENSVSSASDKASPARLPMPSWIGCAASVALSARSAARCRRASSRTMRSAPVPSARMVYGNRNDTVCAGRVSPGPPARPNPDAEEPGEEIVARVQIIDTQRIAAGKRAGTNLYGQVLNVSRLHSDQQ